MIAERAGSRLGQYQVIRRIASGGMAEIYLASQAKIEGCEKLVVIKRILPSLASDVEYAQMLLNEARVIAQLSHPNIISFVDIESRNGQFIIVMEFLFGRDLLPILMQACAKNCFIPLGAALSTVLGVCAGLHYAHEKTGRFGEPLGIIHRDISPQNIFVTFDGCVKLIDFGIAKLSQGAAQTRPGTVKGKLSYLSPEQARGETVDRRSDIFSLCIVLWELTTRTKLFKGKNEYEVMKGIIDAGIPRPSAVMPSYPSALEQIVMKGLAHAPADRWQTAEELQLALEQFTRDQGITVSPLSIAALMRDFFPGEVGPADRSLWNPGVELDSQFFANLPASLRTLRDRDIAWESSSPPPSQDSLLGATRPDLSGSRRTKAPRTRWPLALALGVAASLALGVVRYATRPVIAVRAPPPPALAPPLVQVAPAPAPPLPTSPAPPAPKRRPLKARRPAPKVEADLVDLINDDEP